MPVSPTYKSILPDLEIAHQISSVVSINEIDLMLPNFLR